MFIKPNELPKDVQTSLHHRKYSELFLPISLYGIQFYIPITKKFRIFLGIKKDKGAYPYEGTKKLESFLQKLVDAVYLQVRDTIGVEIKSELSSQMQESFAKIFDESIDKKVDLLLNQKMLEGKKD